MVLPDICFNRSGAGRQHWCRTCFRAYFRDRGQVHRDQAGAAKRRRRERARRLLLEHLSAHPCVDCGEADVIVLESDHVGTKAHTIATLVADGAPPELIRRELAECEVVCVNCHRRRTTARAGWIRGQADWRAQLAARADPQARNFLFIFSHLAGHGCADCGTQDLVVLEFDHVGVKRAMVTRMASHGLSLATIAREIAECEVVCANCHRRRTTARRRRHRLAGGGPA
jgi:hypothetical protein